jgi:hypothetical protein
LLAAVASSAETDRAKTNASATTAVMPRMDRIAVSFRAIAALVVSAEYGRTQQGAMGAGTAAR